MIKTHNKAIKTVRYSLTWTPQSGAPYLNRYT